ncbi:MAG: hypothetical protein H0W44_06025 [Gammaproteobacteria bacterium]|nr:hypothetical protein [Gammaproteobacteria bacterium]
MSNKNPPVLDPVQTREKALSRWDDEGGSVAVQPDRTPNEIQGETPNEIQGETPSGIYSEVPALTHAELVQLRVRVIALENLLISLLSDASIEQLQQVREMASYISPRVGATHHPLTVRAAAQMNHLVERASHFRDLA